MNNTNHNVEEDWDLVIVPQNNHFDLKLKEVWRYRDLLVVFVRRDIVSFYKQSILGPVWFFIQPVFTTLVHVFIFENLAELHSLWDKGEVIFPVIRHTSRPN